MKNEKLRWIGGLRPSQNHGEGRGDGFHIRPRTGYRKAGRYRTGPYGLNKV